jgi:hypothetical protein
LNVPAGWALLPPGDPGLTGRVKKAGPSWTVQERRGRKLFSRGVWAPAATIESVRAALAIERQDPSYARKLEAGRRKRAVDQARYEEDFAHAVHRFLGFAPPHEELAGRLATRCSDATGAANRSQPKAARCCAACKVRAAVRSSKHRRTPPSQLRGNVEDDDGEASFALGLVLARKLAGPFAKDGVEPVVLLPLGDTPVEPAPRAPDLQLAARVSAQVVVPARVAGRARIGTDDEHAITLAKVGQGRGPPTAAATAPCGQQQDVHAE